MPDPPYTAAEVDAAVRALEEPARLSSAQQVVTHAAPSLQGVLSQALSDGGWFSEAHEQQINQALAVEDDRERAIAVSTLVAEETRLGMLVGVAVGFELAHELRGLRDRQAADQPDNSTSGQEEE